jgi:hypothetical protein
MKITLIALFSLLLLFTGCYPSHKSMETSPTWNVYDYAISFKLKDTIEIKIVEYIPAFCNCGVLACASNCIGITPTNDTIRVICLCDTNAFTAGMKVWVVPVTYELKRGECAVAMNSLSEPTPSAIQLKKYRTTDGEFLRKK